MKIKYIDKSIKDIYNNLKQIIKLKYVKYSNSKVKIVEKMEDLLYKNN